MKHLDLLPSRRLTLGTLCEIPPYSAWLALMYAFFSFLRHHPLDNTRRTDDNNPGERHEADPKRLP